MSLYYAQEKAYEVLLGLGSGEGTLAERLAGTVTGSFGELTAEAGRGESELHPDLVGDLLALFEEIQSVQPPNKTIDAILTSLNTLDREELTGIARRMVFLSVETVQTRGEDAWLLESGRD